MLKKFNDYFIETFNEPFFINPDGNQLAIVLLIAVLALLFLLGASLAEED